MWIVLFEAIFIFSLIAIFFQDIKDRLVDWWLFSLMGISGLIINHSKNPFLFWQNLLISTIMLVFIFTTMFLYLTTVKKVNIKEIENQFGMGDVFFIIAWIFSFNPFIFIKLFIAGLVVSLFVYKLVIQRIQPDEHVPLAGLAATFILLAKIAGYFHFINLYS